MVVLFSRKIHTNDTIASASVLTNDFIDCVDVKDNPGKCANL